MVYVSASLDNPLSCVQTFGPKLTPQEHGLVQQYWAPSGCSGSGMARISGSWLRSLCQSFYLQHKPLIWEYLNLQGKHMKLVSTSTSLSALRLTSNLYQSVKIYCFFFATYLAQQNLSYPTIQMYHSAVRYNHIIAVTTRLNYVSPDHFDLSIGP